MKTKQNVKAIVSPALKAWKTRRAVAKAAEAKKSARKCKRVAAKKA